MQHQGWVGGTPRTRYNGTVPANFRLGAAMKDKTDIRERKYR
jgi:hypothetical protein